MIDYLKLLHFPEFFKNEKSGAICFCLGIGFYVANLTYDHPVYVAVYVSSFSFAIFKMAEALRREFKNRKLRYDRIKSDSKRNEAYRLNVLSDPNQAELDIMLAFIERDGRRLHYRPVSVDLKRAASNMMETGILINLEHYSDVLVLEIKKEFLERAKSANCYKNAIGPNLYKPTYDVLKTIKRK
jgi:hypothetical protein